MKPSIVQNQLSLSTLFASLMTGSPLRGSAASRPVIASRVKWEYPPSFDATPFLSNGVVRAAFEDPEVLRKPADEWPKSRPAKVHCSREELLSLADRWDSLGACSLVPLAEKSTRRSSGVVLCSKEC